MTERGELGRELADLAASLAAEAGELVRSMADEARATPATKSSSSDLVTAADRAAEELITAGIVAARPDDGIVGEEGATRRGSSSVEWHVDPIDGTTNFVYGIPAYSISIAAAIDDRVVAGVVLDPSSGELYRATLGGGATVDGRPLACRPPTDLSTALVATGSPIAPPPGASRAASSPNCSRGSATSGASDRRRSTSAPSPPAGWTPTTSGASTAGTRPPAR